MIAADLIRDMVLAAIPAVGFGMLFNVPARLLWHCAILGAIGHGLRLLLLHAYVPLELATLVAASVVSFIGVWQAQRLHAHPKVFTVAAVIPMIPGVPLFTALIAIQQVYEKGATPERLAQAIDSGLRASVLIAALAIGLAMPGLVYYRRRPVV
ncbi:MAG TPA: threonine/serine exporter family protein [Opitutaceae bacterium]|nr:threonine/serine exporter family protein [Opitutaceae bacterium]